MKSFLLFLFAITAIVIAAGMTERAAQRKDLERYPQVGRSVDIGGRKLNIFCSGNGRPVVVFDTYGHTAGYAWTAVQSAVAKFTRACWYDRAAYGWSDPATGSRTFRAVADDLHKLLQAAGEPAPFLLAGDRDAALHIRVYHSLFPTEVAGVVMVNASDADAVAADVPESAKGPLTKNFGPFAPEARIATCSVMPMLADAGIFRLMRMVRGRWHTDAYGLSAEQQAELDVVSDRPDAMRANEICFREENMEQARRAGNLGDLPLVVLASTTPIRSSEAMAWNKYQVEHVQPAIASLSSRSRLFLVDGDVSVDAIVRAVRDVVGTIEADVARAH